MIEILDFIFLFLAGLGGGILAGMLGIGGGIIYVMIFTTYLPLLTSHAISEYDLVKLTISNSVFAIIFVGLAGSIKQLQKKNFFLLPVMLLGIPGIAGSILTTEVINAWDIYSRDRFTFLFTVFMIPLIIRMLTKPRHGDKTETDIPNELYAAIGFISGIGMALSGLGGGFIVIPILNGILRIPMKKVVSISLGMIATMSLGLSIYNMGSFDYAQLDIAYTFGSIVLPMVIPVIPGVLLGAPLGVLISHKLPDRTLKILFVIFIFIVIIKLYIDL